MDFRDDCHGQTGLAGPGVAPDFRPPARRSPFAEGGWEFIFNQWLTIALFTFSPRTLFVYAG